MQWKLPAKFSHFIQRAGRAARGRGRTGLAVLLVERTAYTINICTTPNATKLSRKVKVNGSSKPKKSAAEIKRGKQYAVAHGLKRGGTDGYDAVPRGEQPQLKEEIEDKGLLAFVQSTTCRRIVWAKAFNNDPTALGMSLAIMICNVSP